MIQAMYVAEQMGLVVALILLEIPIISGRNRLLDRRSDVECVCMLEPDEIEQTGAAALEQIYARAPRGALAVAGTATVLVFALWFAFYLFVFIPRGFLR